jgi:quercetin dioxygenase-like cupin family protein
MEPFLIDVQPRNGEHPPLSSHEGEEFIYVLEGRIEINYGKTDYTLEAGDSIYYDSIVPHDVHALGGNARILAVVYTPF